MTPNETLELLKIAGALYPDMRFTDESLPVWHHELQDLDFAAARDALLEHGKTSSWSPRVADIRRLAAPPQRTDPAYLPLPPAPARTVPPEEVSRLVRETAAALPRPGQRRDDPPIAQRRHGDVLPPRPAGPPPVRPTMGDSCVFCGYPHIPLSEGVTHDKCAGSGTRRYSGKRGDRATCSVCRWSVALTPEGDLSFHERAVDLAAEAAARPEE